MKAILLFLILHAIVLYASAQRPITDADIETMRSGGRLAPLPSLPQSVVRNYCRTNGLTGKDWLYAVSNYVFAASSMQQQTLAGFLVTGIDSDPDVDPLPFLSAILQGSLSSSIWGEALPPYIRRNAPDWKPFASKALHDKTIPDTTRSRILLTIIRRIEILPDHERPPVFNLLLSILPDDVPFASRYDLDRCMANLYPNWITSETRRETLEAWIQDSRDDEESSYWAGLLDRVQRGDYSSPYPKLPETPVAWPPVIKHINPIPMITEKRAATVACEHLQANLYARVSSVQLDEEKKVYVVRLASEKTPGTLYVVTIDAYRGLVFDIHTEDGAAH